MGELCGKTMGTNRAARDGGEGTPAPLLPTVSTGPFALSAQPQPSEEANLALELLELPELETISSAVGRTKPARFRRSRIIWPLMLMSSGEWECRLQGKDGKSGKRQNFWDAAKPILRETCTVIKKQERGAPGWLSG